MIVQPLITDTPFNLKPHNVMIDAEARKVNTCKLILNRDLEAHQKMMCFIVAFD